MATTLFPVSTSSRSPATPRPGGARRRRDRNPAMVDESATQIHRPRTTLTRDGRSRPQQLADASVDAAAARQMVGQYPTRHARPTRLPHRRRSAARRESHPTQPRMTEVGRVGASSSCFLKPPRMAAAMARVRPARTVTDKLFPYLSYQDARKALDWLSAIGFSVIRSQLGDNDVVDHAEVRRGQAMVSTCSKE